MWFSRNKRIYLDHASAPPVCREAIAAMRKAEDLVGNPGAIHAEAVAAKNSLDRSREGIAAILACKSREIVFTSGLTEADNLAILGYARKLEQVRRGLTGTHWIASSIEHPAVLESFAEIERLGGEVTTLDPDARGMFQPEAVGHALRKETVFVSIGWANHEIGVVQELRKIKEALSVQEKKFGTEIIFHSDAGQAPLYIAPHVHTLGVDLLSLGSNKLYGPHGIGALYISNRTALAPMMIGGSQERGLRAGTENVALAAGFAAAFDAIDRERAKERPRVAALRDDLLRRIQARFPDAIVNGDSEKRLPHMLNISIPDIRSEYVTLALDRSGIAVSTKSACSEGEERRSHVVAALGGDIWRAENTLRFSVGRSTRLSDIVRAVSSLAQAVILFREKNLL